MTIPLKFNGLTNLQDARYAAALPEVGWISLPVGRGLEPKLPLKDAVEILAWLEGPRLVLDFAADAEGLDEFLRSHAVPTAWCFQVADSVDRARLELPEERTVLTLATLAALPPNAGALALLEYTPTESEADAVNDLVAVAGNVSLNLDRPGLPFLARLQHAPAAVAFEHRLREDFTQLDYDAVERLLNQVGLDRLGFTGVG